MYTFNMLDHAELYRNDRLREAANARMRPERPVLTFSSVLVVLGGTLTGLGGALTTLGTNLAGRRTA